MSSINTNVTRSKIGTLNQYFGIDGEHVDQQNTRIKAINNCDGPIESFTGRSTELSDLSSKFNKHNIVVIHGVGGVGKTQLARKFAAVNKNSYNCLFWLQAEFQENLKEQLRQLALEVDIEDGMNRNLNQIRNEIYDILKTQRALLIFDNILNEADIKKYLPPVTELKNTKLHILITSQFLDWNENTVKCLPLIPFEEFYALELVNTILNTEFNTNRANAKDRKELVRMLEYMPLAIQIAASYINTQMKQNDAFTITRYIEKLTNDATNIHKSKHIEYGKTLGMSIKMSLDIIREDNSYAMELVYIMSFLNPDSITKDVLSKILKINSKDAEENFCEALQMIINYSLISSFNNILHLHRNIQEIIRDELTQIDTDIFLKYYKLVLDYVLNNEDQVSIRNTFVFKYAKDYTTFILQYYKTSKSAKLLQLLCEHDCLKNVKMIFTYLKRNKVNCLIKRHGLLHCATSSSDIEIVKIICKYNIDVNMKYGTDNTTSLHIACMHGFVDIADFLIDKGADTNMKCENGRIALHYASSGLHYDIVHRLLCISPNTVEDRDKKNKTPLQLVLNTHKYMEANDNAVKIARLLVEKGANPDTANDNSYKVIHIAALNGNYDFLAYLLDNYKLDVNAKNKYGNTPLFNAVAASKFMPKDHIMHQIKLLIKNEANVETTINNYGATVLHIAALHCHNKIISYLIQEHNISVDTPDSSGRTPLFYALLDYKSISEEDVMATVKLLIKNGADVKTITNNGYSLLHVASQFCHDKIISYLIQEHNISVDTPDSSGQTPLYCALLASKSIPEDDVMTTVKLLIEKGADVKTITNYGYSLLHVASQFCHDKIISYLIQEHNISVDTPDSSGQTPLYCALLASKSIPEDDVMTTVKLLIENGADVETICNHGCSLLHIASQYCHDKFIPYLIQKLNISIDTPDNDGDSPLFCAVAASKSISDDDVLTTVRLLIENGADVATINNDGCSLLHVAAKNCRDKIISYLIQEHNISVNTPNNNGESPLFSALLTPKSVSEDDILKTIKLLIEMGARVDILDNKGNSLFHIAADKSLRKIITYLFDNHKLMPLLHALLASELMPEDKVMKVIELLAEKRAHVGRTYKNGTGLLHVAARYGCHEIVLHLIQKYDLPVTVTDSLGRSPLFCALKARRFVPEEDVMETTKLLIAQGATVEATDNTGRTLLHYAAQFGRYQALTYLLHNSNINIDTKDQDGDTPLHCALIAGESINQETVKKIIKKLLFKGASIKLKNNKDQTALDLASSEVREFILKSYAKASKRRIPQITEQEAKRRKK